MDSTQAKRLGSSMLLCRFFFGAKKFVDKTSREKKMLPPEKDLQYFAAKIAISLKILFIEVPNKVPD